MSNPYQRIWMDSSVTVFIPLSCYGINSFLPTLLSFMKRSFKKWDIGKTSAVLKLIMCLY